MSIARAALALGILVGAASCWSDPTRERPASSIDYFEVVSGAPTADGESLPLLIGIHGLGDTPELFFRAFGTDMPVRARMIFPRAPLPHGNGFSWFELPDRASDVARGDFSDGIEEAGERLAALIGELVRVHAPDTAPIVFGYSQGGMLSFYLAARHAGEISAAVPIAAFLPPGLRSVKGRPAPTFAFHGALDELVPVESARQTVAALRAAGGVAELREYAHVGHSVTLALVRDAVRKIVEVEAAGRSPPS